MRVLLFIFLLSFLSFNLNAAEDELYFVYQEYSTEVDRAQTVLPLMQYYSDDIYKSFEIYFKQENLKEGIDTLFSRLKFPSNISNVSEHYEIIDDGKGCLIVSGKSQEKKPTSIYVGLIKKTSWKIDFINVEFLADGEKYLKTPICDVDALMKKRMEAWGQ